MTYVLAKSPVRKPINQLKKYKVNGVKKNIVLTMDIFIKTIHSQFRARYVMAKITVNSSVTLSI